MNARAKTFFILFFPSLLCAIYIFYKLFQSHAGLAGLAVIFVIIIVGIFSLSFLGMAIVNLKRSDADTGLHKNISVPTAFIGLAIFGFYFLPTSWFNAHYFGWQGVSLLLGLVLMLVSLVDIISKGFKKK